METLGYFIVIFISLCLLSIFIIIIEYFRPIFLDWLLKKEFRLFSFLFVSLFSISSYSTYLLIKPSIDILYCIFYVFIIAFSTVACFFIFFKIRKTTYSQKKLPTINIELDKSTILNKETLNTNNEELVEKLNYKDISKDQKQTYIINYNSFFTPNQINYLWTKLRGHEIIDDNYSKNDFYKNFLNEKIVINMDSYSLYYFHKEIRRLINEKISLKEFIAFFLDDLNNEFIHGSVNNGSQKQNHKLIDAFKDIFDNFPEKISITK